MLSYRKRAASLRYLGPFFYFFDAAIYRLSDKTGTTCRMLSKPRLLHRCVSSASAFPKQFK